MYKFRSNKTKVGGAFTTLELIFHAAVRGVRSSHANAVMALLVNIIQSVALMLSFLIFMSFMGLRTAAVRGDFVLFVMSGIFPFMTNIKAVQSVMKAAGPTNPLMRHTPMNNMVSIAGALIGQLYVQVLTAVIILVGYHSAFKPITIEDPISAMGMLILAWFVGAAIGMFLLAVRPWLPMVATMASMVYRRAQMIASGKMMAGNAIPNFMLPMFIWNPLFHIIDQMRGYIFLNYYPHRTDWTYAIWVGLVFLLIGMMGEFFGRLNVSKSMRA
jgi:ABC-type polysaccharide/polyol phosphate export permease